VKFAVQSDGRLDSYVYEYGNYATNADPALCLFTPSTSGVLYVRTTVTHGFTNAPAGIPIPGLTNAPAGVAYRTTQDASVEDPVGNTVQQETRVYTGAGYDRIDWTVNELDQLGRVVAQLLPTALTP